MNLADIVKPIDRMTDEELLERLREIRHRRSIERPAAKAIVDRAERKATRGKLSAIDKLLAGLSEEDRARLLEQLEGGSNGGNSEGTGSQG